MRRKILFFLATLVSLNSFSLENKFEHITTDDGLSQANVLCIFQDSKGFIWIGTYNGLNRFDGYEMVIYNHEKSNPNSLSNEQIDCITEDRKGQLWIGTRGGGITVFDPKSNTFHRIDSTLYKNEIIHFQYISDLDVSPTGEIWVSDENTGVYVFNDDKRCIKAFRPNSSKENSLPTSNYYGVKVGHDGTAWIGVGNGILAKIPAGSDEVEIKQFEDLNASSDDGIRSMFLDMTGKIWLGTKSQGAYMYSPGFDSFINYRAESEEYKLPSNTVMGFEEDTHGNIYMAMDGGGISMIDHITGEILTITYDPGNPESLNTNAVYFLLFDNSENLWVGTYAQGVNFQSKYKNKFRKYVPDINDKNSLSYKNVNSLLQDDRGKIWIGTDGGGLNKFDMATDSFTHYRADPNDTMWLQADVILHLMQDYDGDIYIGSYNEGLTIFNQDEMSWTQYFPDENDPTSIAGKNVWYTYQDGYGDIWIGLLSAGLERFNKTTQTFEHFTSNPEDPNSLQNPNIIVIYEDLNQDLWIGTEGGGLHLYNREENNFTSFMSLDNNPNSISNNSVITLYEDLNMRFWVGTKNGLCLMDREAGTFKNFYKEDGLPGNAINGILEDDMGYLWLATDGGICKFQPDSMIFKNYDKTDGLQGNEFNYTASLITNNGYFLFGGKNGFNMFFPSEIRDNPYPPKVVITNISILNKPNRYLTVKEDGKEVTRAVHSLNKLKLSHKQNIITFEFAALDFGNSMKNQYKYMLEGFDETWTTVDASKRFATYTNLPGGDYVFKVLASNGDGVWNTSPTTLELTITPPFWKRTWFIILVILIIVAFAIYLMRRREQSMKADKLKLEQKIQEGLKVVEKQKEEVARKNLEIQQKVESEKEQNWYNNGVGRISAVMSQNKDDLHQLAQSIITEIVEYVEVSQGAIYLINDDKEDEIFLELSATYAPDEKRLECENIKPGEGQIGTCYSEKRVIKVDNLPDDYAVFSSGLGEAPMKNLTVVPLKLNEIVIGVVELLSFEPVPDYRINFIEKSGETLTSMLTALKANEKTKKLLEEQKMQGEELSAQEEELRQNLEEMQATQEELTRMKEAERLAEEERLESERELMEQLKVQNEELQAQQEALEKEEYLFNALLLNSNEHIYFKDDKSRFIRVSNSMLNIFKVNKMEEVIGKSDSDFFDEEHAKPALLDEQKIMNSGKPMKDKIEKEVHKDGSVSWVSTTKMPLIDSNGKIIGTWGISKDVTKSYKIEEEVLQTKENSAICETMFDQAINTLSGNIAVFNDKGNLFALNNNMANAYKVKKSEVSKKSIYSLLSEEDATYLKTHLTAARKKGKAAWKSQDKDFQLIRVFIEDLKTSYFMLLYQ